MLLLLWLGGAFVVVAAINLYLRYFGLPRVGSSSTSVGAGAATAYPPLLGSAGGGLFGTRSTGVVGAWGCGSTGGESVGWFNVALAWMHQRCAQTPEFVDAWLRALTLEAEKQQHQAGSASTPMHLRFDGVHGPSPDFSNISTDSSASDQLTIYGTLNVKEVMLQLCCAAQGSAGAQAGTTQTVNCDARIQWIKGQVKLVVKLIDKELSLNIGFVQPPDVKLQVRPTRINAPMDPNAVENAVRAAIGGATTNISWLSRPSTAGGRTGWAYGADKAGTASGPERWDGGQLSPQMRQPQQQISLQQQQQQQQQQQVSMQQQQQQQFPKPQPPQLQHQLSQQSHGSLQSSQSYGDPFGNTVPNSNVGQLNLAGQQQSQQQAGQRDVMQSANLSYSSRPPVPDHGITFNASGDRNVQKLLVKIIKANGLVDTDWGSCNAYCLMRVDQPAQSFMTNVIHNTVNPLWDEQFICDIDGTTKWIQFEVLDRDKPPESDLLGKATVVLEEIRRMPSSRQIIPLTGRPRSRTSTSGSVTVELVFMDSSMTGLPPGQTGSMTSHQQGVGGFTNQAQPGDRSQYNDSQTRGRSGQSSDHSPYPNRATGGVGGPGGNGAPLSAHDLALTSTHPGSPPRSQESPSLVITAADSQRGATLQSGSRGGTLDSKGKEKKESFAATLKKKFALKKNPRSQSADRFQSSSLRESSLLMPPGAGDHHGQTRLQDDPNQCGDGRQTRSNSFGSSLRRIFKTKSDKNLGGGSRDGSLNRRRPQEEIIRDGSSSYGLQTGNRGGSASYGQTGSFERSARQSTPVPPGRDSYEYSSSVPTGSPTQSRY